jgi:hypothetical protein
VRLHVEARNPNVELLHVAGVVYGRRSHKEVLEILCRAPCDQYVDARGGEAFLFGGPGVTPSAAFDLGARQGEVAVAVDAGSSRKRNLGWFSTGLGVALAAAGGALVIGGTVSDRQTQTGQTTPNTSGNGEKAAGGVLLGVAAAAVVTGIALVATSGTTWTLRSGGAAASAKRAAPSWRALLGGTLASF